MRAPYPNANRRIQPVNAHPPSEWNTASYGKDGPFADSKEQLGGYYLIDVPDLDAALLWAGRCPAARHGTVEVRAIWAM